VVEIGVVVLEKKSFKGKKLTPDRRTDAAPWYKISWPWPGVLKMNNKKMTVY